MAQELNGGIFISCTRPFRSLVNPLVIVAVFGGRRRQRQRHGVVRAVLCVVCKLCLLWTSFKYYKQSQGYTGLKSLTGHLEQVFY